jgi:cellulose synthase operon protein YhjQ
LSDSESPDARSPKNDVRALFDKAHLGNGRYRTFAQPKAPTPPRALEASEREGTAPVVKEVPAALEATNGNLRRTLHSVFEVNSRLRTDAFRPRLTPGSRAAIAFASCAGGVGKTTLCATIARVLSSRLANILVADRCVDGIIPFYFNLDRQSAGGLQTVYPSARRAGYQMTLVAAASDPQPNAAAAAATAAWLQQLQTESVLTLLDLPTLQGSLSERALDGGSQVVVPLVPDVQSVASIARMEELAGRLEEGQDTQTRTLFVLNRFEEARPLHREIRTHLEKLLEGRLAPFAIRESEYVPEALSLGMTVLDHLPQSAVAKDLEQFAGWLETQCSSVAEASAEKMEIA